MAEGVKKKKEKKNYSGLIPGNGNQGGREKKKTEPTGSEGEAGAGSQTSEAVNN